MIQILASKAINGFDWVDLSAPENEEIKQVAGQYALHEASIKDCPQSLTGYSYPAVMLLMAGIAIGIYYWFKRKGWL